MRFKKIRVALSFLTSLPIPISTEVSPEDFGRAGGWFPVVGLLIGGLLALVSWGSSQVFAPLVSGVLVTAAWALLTGGLHLDGLADSCDGLFAEAHVERRLEIMKDPRLGAFGAIGLVLTLMLKTALAADLAQRGLWLAFPLAASLGRWVLLAAARQPSARPGGLGDAFGRGVRSWQVILSAGIPLGLLVWSWMGAHSAPGALIGTGLALLTGMGIVAAARIRLGGLTGDVYGMLVEWVELAVLLGMALHF